MGEDNLGEGPLFEYNREEIIQYCNKLTTLEEQIRYLGFVLLERKNNPPELDCNAGKIPTLENYIKNEISYRKLLLKTCNAQRGVRAAEVVKITGRIPDVVRIFEAMKAAEIISLKTEATQIGRIFFNEKIDVKEFASRFNARKKDLIEEERSTTSESLLIFINTLIDISYKGKPEFLDKIANHIDCVRRKSYIR